MDLKKIQDKARMCISGYAMYCECQSKQEVASSLIILIDAATEACFSLQGKKKTIRMLEIMLEDVKEKDENSVTVIIKEVFIKKEESIH